MIGCDNDDCQFQWFHLGCVNVKPPLPEVGHRLSDKNQLTIFRSGIVPNARINLV